MTTTPDTDAAPTPVECRHCGRPFATDQLRALHVGHSHPGAASDRERAAFEAAYDAESEALRRYRLKALAALLVAYFGFLFTYAVVG